MMRRIKFVLCDHSEERLVLGEYEAQLVEGGWAVRDLRRAGSLTREFDAHLERTECAFAAVDAIGLELGDTTEIECDCDECEHLAAVEQKLVGAESSEEECECGAPATRLAGSVWRDNGFASGWVPLWLCEECFEVEEAAEAEADAFRARTGLPG